MTPLWQSPTAEEIMAKQLPQLIRDSEAATLLSCSRSTFWRRVADGTVPPPLRFGRIVRWRTDDIKDVIAKAVQNRGRQ